MKFMPQIDYPDEEQSKLKQLDTLFREWHQHFANSKPGLEKQMVFDGFYPHYFKENNKRILFIGWEAYELAGEHYIDIQYPHYRVDKYIGEQHINCNKFHRKLIYIAYGILNNRMAWREIDYASKIGDDFGTGNGLSFAFMNISKVSNETGATNADTGLIGEAYRLSVEGRNFIQEEITILDPHIIITMNLGNKIDSIGKLTLPLHSSELASSFWLNLNGHRSLVIDTCHFSRLDKKDLEDYYTPICDAIQRSEATA